MMQPPPDIATRDRIVPGVAADLLAAASYRALIGDLRELSGGDWNRPTDCAGWTVRDMVAHLVGAAQGHASLPVFIRQYIWGVRHRGDFGGSGLDAMNQGQINGLRAVSDQDLLGLLDDFAPKAVHGRAQRSRLIGWAPLSLDQTGSWYEGMPTKTTMGELCSVILTRDVWMHRLDLARALNTTPTIEPETDATIVADLVSDWAARHRQPFDLTLTGPAGGTFRVGQAGQRLTLDALDFARLMAGRKPEADVADSPLWATKVLF
jgi:uncharacterized protein (TIGR03083 family)